MRLGIDIGGTSAKVAVWSQGRWLRTGQSASYDQPTLSQIRAAIQTAAGPIANFVLAAVPQGGTGITAQALYEGLKSRGILVRWWDLPRIADKVRITIGTPEQNDRLLAELKTLI